MFTLEDSTCPVVTDSGWAVFDVIASSFYLGQDSVFAAGLRELINEIAGVDDTSGDTGWTQFYQGAL